MSKQDIRDEMKEMDGNPVVKQRIRRIRRDLARRRMMQEVATATAVIVNPTHYAVALKYSLESRGAPIAHGWRRTLAALEARCWRADNKSCAIAAAQGPRNPVT